MGSPFSNYLEENNEVKPLILPLQNLNINDNRQQHWLQPPEQYYY
jgi:hypothetical protein